MTYDPRARTPAPREAVINPLGTSLASNAVWTDVQSNAAYLCQRRTAAGTQDEYEEYEVVLASGTYKMDVFFVSATTLGTAAVTINGDSVGSVDFYAAAAERKTTLSDVYVFTGGTQRVRFTNSEKNALSSGYGSRISWVHFTRTGPLPTDAASRQFYVNSQTGSDANNGYRPSTAFASLTAAFDACTGTGPYTIKVASTLANPVRPPAGLGSAPLAQSSGAPITVEPVGGSAYIFASETFTSGWTDLGGGVYTRSLTGYWPSSMYVAVCTTLTDADGNYVKLVRDGANTNPAAGFYGYDGNGSLGGDIWIHLPGGVSANSHTMELSHTSAAIKALGAGKVTVSPGIHLMFANQAGLQAGDGLAEANDGYVEATSVFCEYNGQQNFYLNNVAQQNDPDFLAVSCTATNNTDNDGFSVHGGGKMRLVAPQASYNAGQGFTTHETGWLVVEGGRNGRAHHNGSGGYVGVDTSRADFTDVEADHNYWNTSPAVGSAAGFSFAHAGMSGSLVNCDSHDNNARGIFTKSGSSVTVDAASLASSGVANGNAVADSIQG